MAGAAEATKQARVGSGSLGHQVKFGFSSVGNGEPWKVLEEERNINNNRTLLCGVDYGHTCPSLCHEPCKVDLTCLHCPRPPTGDGQ